MEILIHMQDQSINTIFFFLLESKYSNTNITIM